MNQSIRIIGGRYRGKIITFPETTTLRPTPSRVRETLFNWLMHDIRGSNCLDAFAGSGALGLEALSRNAAAVTLLEQDPLVYNHLKKTVATFKAEKIQIHNIDAYHFLQTTNKTFDIIFLDPPFKSDLLMQVLNELSTRPVLAPKGLVYVESAVELVVDEHKWKMVKGKRACGVAYGVYTRV